jgi:tetratricopeptide (TPR) repeat protein
LEKRKQWKGKTNLTMTTDKPAFSADFQRVYFEVALFEPFSAFHPISFRRVVPFQHPEEGVDKRSLLNAEEAHLAARTENTRRAVVDEYCRCGLLEEAEADDLNAVIDFYGADFFELMGLLYANAGRFRCALRWYGEWIRELETRHPDLCCDTESVYASVGYCLYSLGLFEEAIAWSKACIGPRQAADAVCRTLIGYEAELAGGLIRAAERSGARTRYIVSAFDPAHSSQAVPRLKAAMKAFAPFQEVYIDWVSQETPSPGIQAGGYPFRAEIDGGSLVRHKLNLIFASCGRADALVERGYRMEAKRLLAEAAMVEPEAEMLTERLRTLA